MLIAYTPTVTQVMRLREVLDADPRWGLTQTSETMHRTWHVDGLAVRPDHRMVAHTAFLTTARRMVPLEADEIETEATPTVEAEPADDAPVGPRPGQLP
jgi:tRNA (adenine57-N1/adenine58-N1)-methyltransferase